MKYIRATKRRAQNYRDAHTRILILWRDGAKIHRPHEEIFKACQVIIDNADVTNDDRRRLKQTQWAMREYSVLTHARWQLYLDGNPVTSAQISAKREAGDEDVWLRIKGRHEWDDSHDPYYDREDPHWLHTSKQHCNEVGRVHQELPK